MKKNQSGKKGLPVMTRAAFFVHFLFFHPLQTRSNPFRRKGGSAAFGHQFVIQSSDPFANVDARFHVFRKMNTDFAQAAVH
ncbi:MULTISPECIES: hypothetical protein [Bacillaceae]|uniref:hypothetical protein n=1 Tax=Bacillaceae TaxID=186817 RepID=UPI00039B6E6A|nr:MULTISPECIES: hypothetical protein [Bacillaceae]